MGKTLRRKPWYPKVKGALGLKAYRDASCKPGCPICGKHFPRVENRKARRKFKVELDN